MSAGVGCEEETCCICARRLVNDPDADESDADESDDDDADADGDSGRRDDGALAAPDAHADADAAWRASAASAAAPATYTLPECGHTFHTSCILQWFRQGQAVTCPLCRDLGSVSAGVACAIFGAVNCEDRGRILSTVARRRDAPAPLRKLAASARQARQGVVDARKELRAYQRAHKVVLSRVSRLKAAVRARKQRERSAAQRLALYSGPGFELPALLLG